MKRERIILNGKGEERAYTHPVRRETEDPRRDEKGERDSLPEKRRGRGRWTEYGGGGGIGVRGEGGE